MSGSSVELWCHRHINTLNHKDTFAQLYIGGDIRIGDVGQTNILAILPAILSEVSPVIILENVKTAINAGPAKIWYSIPLPE